jgi:hypothetical protein
MEMDKEFAKKELEKKMREAELKDMAKRAFERNIKNLEGTGLSDFEKEAVENLLKPGEDPGEGYKGSPDMYPDYEEDEKDQKLGRTSTKEFKAIQKMMDKKSTGGSILVKTKLGRTKPTKIY